MPLSKSIGVAVIYEIYSLPRINTDRIIDRLETYSWRTLNVASRRASVMRVLSDLVDMRIINGDHENGWALSEGKIDPEELGASGGVGEGGGGGGIKIPANNGSNGDEGSGIREVLDNRYLFSYSEKDFDKVLDRSLGNSL